MKKTNETSKNIILIDPPSGWKYGFPKAVTQEEYKTITNLKDWCIQKGYPKKEADSYGEYFHVQINGDLSFMSKEKSTRELAAEWFSSKSYLKQHELSDKYFESRNPSLLTIQQVEQIYHNEVIEPKLQEAWNESQVNQKQFVDKPQSKEIRKALNNKYNQKQFKEFNPELFKAYIDKFSDEDKFKAFSILAKQFENHIYGFYKDGDFDRAQNNACYASFKSRFNTLFNK